MVLAYCLFWASVFLKAFAQNGNVTLAPAAVGFEADNTAFYYSSSPLLVANDGSAANGGFRTFDVQKRSGWPQNTHLKTGRSKVALPISNVGGRDIVVTIAATDSIMRVFDAQNFSELVEARKSILGDWSTLCSWRSTSSGNVYLFLFGKKMTVQLLVRSYKRRIQFLEVCNHLPEENATLMLLQVHTFSVPIEGESCAVFLDGTVFFSAEDQPLFSFKASESTQAPAIDTASETIPVIGLATYHGSSRDYLFVLSDEDLNVYDNRLESRGKFKLSGMADLSVEGGLSILQSASKAYPSGAFALAFEGEKDTGVAVGSLKDVLSLSGIQANIKFNPGKATCRKCMQPLSSRCSSNGYRVRSSCQCLAGFAGQDCSRTTCQKSCSGHGSCIGPNVCKCASGWAGPDCSFKAVQAKYETDANGGDGDDPAIWIHPTLPEQSRIITTTKSEEGAGFSTFDLKGNLLQHVSGEEPNNVDVIFNFTLGTETTDLTFAACRGDNTLWYVNLYISAKAH